MRRLVGPLLALLLVVLGACGGSDPTTDGSPESTALSYLPKDAIAAFVVQTDPQNGQVRTALDLVRRFPGGDAILARAQAAILSSGVGYGRDVKPLLGNPLGFAITDAGGRHFVIAWQVKDEHVLARLAAKGQKIGEYQGATLYRSGGTIDAVDGSVVVAADSPSAVHAALDRHAKGDGLSSHDIPADLPRDALVRATGSLAGTLALPQAAQARAVPWIAALKRYGFAVTASDSGVGVELRADTTGRKLTEADVPLATGDAAPKVADTGQLAVGVRDLAHVFTFALRAAAAVNPSATTRFQAQLQALKGLAGVDVQRDVIGQLDSDATIGVGFATGRNTVTLRATAKDPAVLGHALSRLERIAPSIIGGAGLAAPGVRRVAPGFWAVTSHGSVIGGYGLVGDQFLAGAGIAPAELRALAAGPAAVPPGAKGSVAVKLPGTVFAKLISARLNIPPALAAIALSRLGDLHGGMRATPAGLSGSFKQEIR